MLNGHPLDETGQCEQHHLDDAPMGGARRLLLLGRRRPKRAHVLLNEAQKETKDLGHVDGERLVDVLAPLIRFDRLQQGDILDQPQEHEQHQFGLGGSLGAGIGQLGQQCGPLLGPLALRHLDDDARQRVLDVTDAGVLGSANAGAQQLHGVLLDEQFLRLRNLVPAELYGVLHQLQAEVTDARVEGPTGQVEAGLGAQRRELFESAKGVRKYMI